MYASRCSVNIGTSQIINNQRGEVECTKKPTYLYNSGPAKQHWSLEEGGEGLVDEVKL